MEGAGFGRGRIGAEQEGVERPGDIHLACRIEVPVECGIVFFRGVEGHDVPEIKVDAEVHFLEIPTLYSSFHIAFGSVNVIDFHSIEHYSGGTEVHWAGGGIFHSGEVNGQFRIVHPEAVAAELRLCEQPADVKPAGGGSGDIGEYGT